MEVIKIPLYAGALSKKKGLDMGPGKIQEHIGSFYLKESGMLPFIEFDGIKIDNSNLGDSHDMIYDKIMSLDVPAILLGGDHSLTFPAFKAFSEKNPDAGLLIFDAHLDCENDFIPPTHEDFLRALITEGHVKKENVIVVGVRNMHSNEYSFAKKNKLKIFSMSEIAQNGKEDIADAFMSVARQFGSLYVSIDIDVLDPAFAPGTGYAEPGGLTTRELLYFIQRLKNLKNIKMWDLVEVNPEKDINYLTSLAAAKLLVEMS